MILSSRSLISDPFLTFQCKLHYCKYLLLSIPYYCYQIQILTTLQFCLLDTFLEYFTLIKIYKKEL